MVKKDFIFYGILILKITDKNTNLLKRKKIIESIMDNYKKPFRVGIILPEFDNMNIAALQFLILHLNTLQNYVEFEFTADFEDNTFISQFKPKKIFSFSSKKKIKYSDLKKEINQFVEDYKKSINKKSEEFNLLEPSPDFFIFISLSQLSNNWYSVAFENISILFLGDWKRYMAPPSLLEIILTMVITETILAVSQFENNRHRSHLGTKGCICDFNHNLKDVRYKTLQSFICSHCLEKMKRTGNDKLAIDLVKLLTKDWFGKKEDPMSPASIVDKLGYDLFLTKGLTPTRWERLIKILEKEGVKVILQTISAISVAASIVWFGLKN